MKICLIRPSIVVPSHNQATMLTPPLGLAYIAGSLNDAEHDVQFIDAVGDGIDDKHPFKDDCFIFGLTPSQTVNKISSDVNIIGIAFGFSFEWPYCRDLTKLIRQRFPNALLIAGGEHATAEPEQVLLDSEVDLVVLGEGEETIVEVASAYSSGSSGFNDIKGVAYQNMQGKTIKTETRKRIRDIDKIPRPAWHLTSIENYLDSGMGFGVNRGRSMPLLASRGCPYECTFCSNPAMWTTRWIPRDPSDLLDEIEYYQKKYGAENFDFYDLTAIVKKSWIIEFCTKIEERGLSFFWQLPSGTRSEAIDDEVASWLYRTGCRNLSYSPESGSPTVLERIKKKIKVGSVIKSIRSSYKQGLNVKCNIIFGFPGETLNEVLVSYWFIIRMAIAGAYDLSVWAFSPYPGSELFELIKNKKKLSLNDAYYDSLRSYADTANTVSYSENFTDKKLRIIRHIGFTLFYVTAWLIRPYRPFKLILNVARNRQESRGDMGILNILRRNRLKIT
jgi:anaerobic magnesium-protoporphyrin IX monomethyl ester cyclase